MMFVRVSVEVASILSALMIAPHIVELDEVRVAGMHVGRVFWADSSCPHGRLNQSEALTLMDTWQPIAPEIFEVARNDGYLEQSQLQSTKGVEEACGHVEQLYGAHGASIPNLWNKDDNLRERMDE